MKSIQIGRWLAFAAVCVGGQTLTAAEQTWRAEPVDALWNATSPNWDDGTTWTSNNVAVFGASTVTNVVVDGLVATHGVRFTVDGYEIGGDGALLLPSAVGSNFEVPANCTATLCAMVTNLQDAIFQKTGAGTLTLKNP